MTQKVMHSGKKFQLIFSKFSFSKISAFFDKFQARCEWKEVCDETSMKTTLNMPITTTRGLEENQLELFSLCMTFESFS